MKKDILIIGIIVVLLILIVYTLSHTSSPNTAPPKPASDTLTKKYEVPREYGFNLDSVKMDKYTIESGENLSIILEKLGFGTQLRHTISLAAKDVVDVRKFKAGAFYALVVPKQYEADSTGRIDSLKYFVYEPSPLEYVVFAISDTITTKKIKRKQIVQEKQVAGIITSSLWNACVDNGIDPMVAINLSDIYAWSVDFFGLQKGDKFKVIYEETTIEGNATWYKIGKVKTAVFNHIGKDYIAIPYNTGRDSGYFDQEGKSLKTFFLKAPLNYSRISSTFSNSRLHPILKIYRAHHGVDYSAPAGTPVHTIADGVVLVANYSGGAGKWVKIQHGSEYTTAYMHLQNFANGIKAGARVTQGQLIGYVGSTGLSTGPHLDFRVWRHGEPIDPLKVVGPPAQPIPDELLAKFNELKNLLLAKLNKIEYPKLEELKPDTTQIDTVFDEFVHDEK